MVGAVAAVVAAVLVGLVVRVGVRGVLLSRCPHSALGLLCGE